MPFAIKPILPIEICSVICPCHFHHNSALPVNELPSSRKNWLANSLLPVPSLPFSLARQCSPTRPPQVLDHQTVSAGEGSQHEGNHSQGALANPLKLCRVNLSKLNMETFASGDNQGGEGRHPGCVGKWPRVEHRHFRVWWVPFLSFTSRTRPCPIR